MSDTPNDRHSSHWSAYWASGPLTSLPEDFRANYDGEIAAFWHDRFQRLPEPASLLDICTGNGALALLAADYALEQHKTFDITAVDAAHIRPDLIAGRGPALAASVSRVRFLPDTPMESFQGPADSLDLAMSQYGIEYCDQERVAPVIARLLKPGAELALICHAASSELVRTMQLERADYERLDALRLVRSLRSWTKGQLDSTRLREHLLRVGQALYPEFQARRSALFAYVLQAINQLVRLDERGLRACADQIGQLLNQLDDGHQRLEDMLRVNRLLSSDSWYRPYEAAGLSLLDQGDIHYQARHHAGTWFLFRKT